MYDVISEHTRLPGPATHASGKHQIDGVFATKNIEFSRARVFPLWIGIGDHCAILIAISKKTLYGESTLNVVRPSCRSLQCYKAPVREKYNSRLETQTRHNKLPKKYQSLNILHTYDRDDFDLAQENLDLII